MTDYSGIASQLLRDADAPNVVVGPLLWRPNATGTGKSWSFTVALSRRGTFVLARVPVADPPPDYYGLDDWLAVSADVVILCGEADHRALLIEALSAHNRFRVRDISQELDEVRLYETLWPCARTRTLRCAVEAELQVAS